MDNPPEEVASLLTQNKSLDFGMEIRVGAKGTWKQVDLLNTFDRKVNDVLNKRPNRTEFMPFAPVVLDFMAKNIFQNMSEKCSSCKIYDNDI